MKNRNLTQTVILIVLITAVVVGYESGLFAGNGKFMVEVKTPSGAAPQATCYLMKDGKQVQSSKVAILTSGKSGCQFNAPATTYNLITQCDNSPIHEDRTNIQILPPVSGQEQTICWGTFYPGAYCQSGKEIILACTSDACDSVVGQACKGNEVWSICKNGILKDYQNTCSSGSCEQTALIKSGQTIVKSEVACQAVDNGSISDRYVQACVTGTCRQMLKTDVGSDYTPCTGIGTGCGTSPSTTLPENTCTYDFQCGLGGSTGDVYCSNGNLVRDSVVKSCVSGLCRTTTKANLVKDCGGWGCDAENGVCKTDDTHQNGCSTNSDCGTDGNVGGLYCLGGNVAQDYKTNTCNSGTCNYVTGPKIVATCSSPLTCDASSGPAKCVTAGSTTTITGTTTTITGSTTTTLKESGPQPDWQLYELIGILALAGVGAYLWLTR